MLNKYHSALALGLVIGGCAKAKTYDELQSAVEDKIQAEMGDGGVACDGPMLGAACRDGVGGCARAGEFVCEDEELVCDAEPAAPGPVELCGDDVDQDCDGVVDEAPEAQCCDDKDCGDEQVCQRPTANISRPGECVALEDARPDLDGGTEQGDVSDKEEGAAAEPEDPCFPASKLAVDPANCGQCGRECASGVECVDGECMDSEEPMMRCPEGEQACGAACVADSGCCDDDDCEESETCNDGICEVIAVDPCAELDLQTDDDNCGECGNACGEDESCKAGSCEADAPECGGADLQTDNENCGTCGNECDVNESCMDGECECPGLSGSYRTDEANCGECGKECGDAERCLFGACVCEADTQNDSRHCGGCGRACSAGDVCVAGRCEAPVPCGGTCSVGQECVSDRCQCTGIPSSTNEEHCGRCGNTCSSAQECINGMCQVPPCGGSCAANEECINEQCRCVGLTGSTQTDENNCGECGKKCPSGHNCVAGQCKPPCGGADLQNDPNNCGQCGVKCDRSNVFCVSVGRCQYRTQCVMGSCEIDPWESAVSCDEC